MRCRRGIDCSVGRAHELVGPAARAATAAKPEAARAAMAGERAVARREAAALAAASEVGAMAEYLAPVEAVKEVEYWVMVHLAAVAAVDTTVVVTAVDLRSLRIM